MRRPSLLIVLIVSAVVALAACQDATPTSAVEDVPEVDCTQGEPQPLVQSIADEFEVSYDQVMAWACAGASLDDIALALQTSQLTDRSPEELLEMKKGMDWDQIWETLGLDAQQAQQG